MIGKAEVLNVYGTCPECRKNVRADKSPSGAWYAHKHKGRQRGKDCPGSLRVVVGWAEPILCAYGCGATVTSPGFACEPCQRWASEVRERIRLADAQAVPPEA